MSTSRIAWPVSMVALLSGCANVPPVTLTYYHATWTATVSVTQTVGCSGDKTRLVVLNSPSVATTYASDLSKPFHVALSDLDSAFSDSEFTIVFTDDGRLKSINQSTTGQGETIVKSAVAVAASIASMTVGGREEPDVADACRTIETWGGGRPVTLSYKATIGSESIGQPVPLPASPESRDLYDRLKGALPHLELRVGQVTVNASGADYKSPSTDRSFKGVLLTLQKTGVLLLTVYSGESLLDAVRIVVPLPEAYFLPIPKGAWFGKQTFSLALTEAGSIASVGYGKGTGTAGALAALGTAAGTQTSAARAAELKAEADVVAQQQRLVLCQTRPDQCK